MRNQLIPIALLSLAVQAGCAPETVPTTPGAAELEDFATRYAAAWGTGDPSAVAAFFAEDGSLSINGAEAHEGRAAIAEAASQFMTDYPDMVVELDSLGREGDRVSFHWTFTGTGTGPGGTGHPVHITGYEEWLFGPDGLIADSRGRYDAAEWERQAAGGAAPPTWEFDPDQVFPADQSLMRPEDGVALADGRLLVVDQAHGLRLVEPDGSSKPFGDMVAAGYSHRPPDRPGGANGVSLEPNGTHLLVADIFGGGIYRVELATGATEQVYRHRYGVNTAVRDSRGAIWFTQSAHNTPEEGEARMWAAVDVPVPEGALLRLGMRDGRLESESEVVVDSLFFANGLAIDETAGHLFLSETVGGGVFRYEVDLDEGSVTDPTLLVDALADNLELDADRRLWVALPLTNELLVVYPSTGAQYSAFRSVTEEQLAVIEEFERRGAEGETRLELFGPSSWAPLPGPLTGVIVGGSDEPVYLTGLGAALIKLDR